MVSSKTLPVYLASASPRRLELLKLVVPAFSVAPSHTDESGFEHLDPFLVPEFLARRKAVAAAAAFSAGFFIAADTVVLVEKRILNKPADAAEAVSMLMMLSNRTHEVVTGVCLLKKLDSGVTQTVSFASRTQVSFGPLQREDAETYARTGSPLDKAGAYGIQDPFMARWVQKIQGDYYNVVGFPVFDFYHQCSAFYPECFASP